jgi:subtilisin family serine protease
MPRLDPELEYLLERKSYFEKHPDEARKNPGAVPDNKQILNISVHFKGSIDPLKQAGFILTNAIGMVAFGNITLENLQKLVNIPDVLTIEKLTKKVLQLDKSVPDIRADKVWSRSGDSFSNITGRDAIVGIIDTGINFRHDSFRRANGTTRILRIWDQTLSVQGSEKFPDPITDAAIVNPANSPTPPSTSITLPYGVEYTAQQINGTLQNANLPVKCRHSDDHGHGTHVAGIAAGNGRQSGGTAQGGCQGNYNYIGVAPEADIIIVRMWQLSANDSSTPPTGAGDVMLEAICYILNHAKHTFNKPVVINLSLGFFGEDMDGSRNDCITMNSLLNNTANDEGFAIVFAAGNEADSSFHAKATVPAGPTATLGIRFRIRPKDKKTRRIRIVYSGNNLQVRVTSPLGATGGIVGWVTNGNAITSNTANGGGAGANVAISNKTGVDANKITVTINPGTAGNNLASTATNDWLLELRIPVQRQLRLMRSSEA